VTIDNFERQVISPTQADLALGRIFAFAPLQDDLALSEQEMDVCHALCQTLLQMNLPESDVPLGRVRKNFVALIMACDTAPEVWRDTPAVVESFWYASRGLYDLCLRTIDKTNLLERAVRSNYEFLPFAALFLYGLSHSSVHGPKATMDVFLPRFGFKMMLAYQASKSIISQDATFLQSRDKPLNWSHFNSLGNISSALDDYEQLPALGGIRPFIIAYASPVRDFLENGKHDQMPSSSIHARLGQLMAARMIGSGGGHEVSKQNWPTPLGLARVARACRDCADSDLVWATAYWSALAAYRPFEMSVDISHEDVRRGLQELVPSGTPQPHADYASRVAFVAYTICDAADMGIAYSLMAYRAVLKRILQAAVIELRGGGSSGPVLSPPMLEEISALAELVEQAGNEIQRQIAHRALTALIATTDLQVSYKSERLTTAEFTNLRRLEAAAISLVMVETPGLMARYAVVKLELVPAKVAE